MAQEKEVAIKISVEAGEGAKSLSALKQEFRETQKTLEGLTVGSREYIKTLEKLGSVRDDIGDLNAEINAFNPEGKVQAFGNVIGGLASGFQAAQGAMALFGVEGEALQQTLLKVQAASALADGVKGVIGLQDSFKVLGSTLKSVGQTAQGVFKGIKGAIASTGIGVFIIALGLIVTYWDDIKAAVSGVNAEQEKLLATQKESVALSKERLGAISAQENILKLQGKSEREILQLKIQATNETITALQAQLETQKQMRQSQIDIAARNKDILTGFLRFSTTPIQLIIDGIDLIYEKVTGKKLIDIDVAEKLASFVFDPEETAKNADAAIKETETALQELLNQRAGFQLSVQAIDKTAYENRKKLREQELKEIEEDGAKELAFRLKNAEEAEKFEEERQKRLAKEKEEQDKIDLDRQIEETQGMEEAKGAVVVIENKKTLKEQLEDQKNYNQALQGISDTFFTTKLANLQKGSEEEKKVLKQQFKVNKALSLAQATITGIEAVQKAVASAPAPFNIPAIVAAAAISAANIAKIAATKFQGDDGGGGSASANLGSASGGVAIAPPQSGSTQLNANGQVINQQDQKQNTLKAYVVETDVTTSQRRIKSIEDKSKH